MDTPKEGVLARMMLIPNNVNQTMDFQGTFFRPMRRAKGAGRCTSSAVKFGFQRLKGGRPCIGMSGQHAAAGRVKSWMSPQLRISLVPRDKGRMAADRFVTTSSHTSPFRGILFRHSAGCRPVSHPVAAVQTTGALTCESTTKTKTTALEFAVANPAVMITAEFAAGRRSLT